MTQRHADRCASLNEIPAYALNVVEVTHTDGTFAFDAAVHTWVPNIILILFKFVEVSDRL